MKNKSTIFFVVALLLFIFVCILVYLYISKNPVFMQNKSKIENSIIPAAQKARIENVSSELEEANKYSTTTEKDIQNVQSNLEQANAKKESATTPNTTLDLQTQLELQAKSEAERRELTKLLEQANR